MDAELLLAESYDLNAGERAELVAWRVPLPLRGSRHRFKYRLAFIVDGECVLRFDNEAGKGDHRHLGSRQLPYDFVDLDTAVTDFWNEVFNWRNAR